MASNGPDSENSCNPTRIQTVLFLSHETPTLPKQDNLSWPVMSTKASPRITETPFYISLPTERKYFLCGGNVR